MARFYEEIHKSDVASDERENIQSRANIDKWIFRLLLLLIYFMPLIVMGSTREILSPLISNQEVLSSGIKGDLFTYYKSLMIIVITIITSILFVSKIFFMNGQIRKTPFNYILGLLLTAILLSTIFSPSISIALNGQPNRSEGAIVWVCYIALIFIAINIQYPKNFMRSIMYCMIPFVLLNVFFITMNFYGKDMLQQEWLRIFVSMTLPAESTISDGSHLLGTLNQWNYMSGMFGMMTVMYLAYSILSKGTLEKIVTLVMAIVSMAITFMSVSTSGFFAIVCIIPLIIWLIFKSNDSKRASLVFALFFIVSGINMHILASENDKVWSESIGFFYKGTNPYTEIIENSESNSRSSFELGLLGEKAFAAENSFELPVLPEGAWSGGTGRTYIWKETLKLVEERPWLGYGLDTLVYHFPHYQLEARGNLLIETIVDKPHNVYLGVLFGTGIFGFIFYMLFVIGTLKGVIKELFAKKEATTLATLAVVWLAFLIQSLFNDTTPAMTGTLFVLVGMPLGIQYNKKEINGGN